MSPLRCPGLSQIISWSNSRPQIFQMSRIISGLYFMTYQNIDNPSTEERPVTDNGRGIITII